MTKAALGASPMRIRPGSGRASSEDTSQASQPLPRALRQGRVRSGLGSNIEALPRLHQARGTVELLDPHLALANDHGESRRAVPCYREACPDNRHGIVACFDAKSPRLYPVRGLNRNDARRQTDPRVVPQGREHLGPSPRAEPEDIGASTHEKLPIAGHLNRPSPISTLIEDPSIPDAEHRQIDRLRASKRGRRYLLPRLPARLPSNAPQA